ncbi:CPBP family intramembrane glutamic endopeptidase [Aquibacillus sediminis]|uniref:CPBP family intramembrane glutamic endopeptidase n=1 Tax=Aquibacillus sediminis TaxID=2574734 RepID=UPI001108EE78|nr:type II CAAX endopeptidase family protein [Aquibacillus sediminis]
MRNRQAELIKSMTITQLKQQLVVSQLILFTLSVVLSFFLFESFYQWVDLMKWEPWVLLKFGIIPGVIVVLIDVILMHFLPKHTYDDGGINEKIFQNLSIIEIIIICLFIAIAEEMLFRGVIQTTFGYVIASFLFAIVHIRYLYKPILFISVVALSFYLGYIYMITSNLLVPIIAHFTIDVLLGWIIRYQKWRGEGNGSC